MNSDDATYDIIECSAQCTSNIISNISSQFCDFTISVCDIMIAYLSNHTDCDTTNA